MTRFQITGAQDQRPTPAILHAYVLPKGPGGPSLPYALTDRRRVLPGDPSGCTRIPFAFHPLGAEIYPVVRTGPRVRLRPGPRIIQNPGIGTRGAYRDA